MAEARLQHLKKLPELKVKYSRVMEEYLNKGYAKELSNEEAATKSDITWYLPHHPVLNPNKPGKVRVVFDAAAKFAGVSLNDMLLEGPSAINDLTGVLLRFRQHEFAFTADIEAICSTKRECSQRIQTPYDFFGGPTASTRHPKSTKCWSTYSEQSHRHVVQV